MAGRAKTRNASAGTMTAEGVFCAAFATAKSTGFVHRLEQFLKLRPRRVGDEADDVAVDQTSRELITAGTTAGDEVAGLQSPFRFREVFKLAFLEHDQRDGSALETPENQRD